MKSFNNSQSDFNKTKKSFEGKKSFMNNTNLANFHDTLNIFNFNNNNNSSTFDKRNSTVNIKVREKQEYEFPNIRTMQKELTQKIYTKESGDIISAVKQSNDNLRNTNNSSIKFDISNINNGGNKNTKVKKEITSKKFIKNYLIFFINIYFYFIIL